MKRDSIDFDNESVSVLFKKLLIPTLWGAISICAVTAIDGIFVGHGVGAFGIACYYTPFFFMVGNAVAQSAQR
ncbi:MAG: hypothetical protein IKD40_05540 [Bacteroidaceae bacterium]|nr:hypothetical protein [Bacteroidaceae bacterium]